VSVTEAKNKLTQFLAAVEKGERISIRRRGRVIAELVPPSARRAPKFGTLKGLVVMTPEQLDEATRPLTREKAEALLEGRH
jgi:prevent-host-death family protein